MYLKLREMVFYVLSLILALLTLPLMIIIAVVVKLTSKGPVFFKQERIGKNGKPFMLYKFRSMHRHAEKKHHKQISKQVIDPLSFKDDAISEITPIGRVLRKTSIDELPQLINILKGEMSVIGPRPLQAFEVDMYSVTLENQAVMQKRLMIKPGLICTWQVTPNKNDMPFDERMQLDAAYVSNMFFAIDVKLLIDGVKTVLRANNK